MPLRAFGDRRARSGADRGDPDRDHPRGSLASGRGPAGAPLRDRSHARDHRRRAAASSSSPPRGRRREIVGADGSREPIDVVVPRPPRALRRGRHRAGPPRAGRRPVRRRGRARLRARDGQGRAEAAVRRGGAPGRSVRGGARVRLGRRPRVDRGARRRRSGTRSSRSRRPSVPPSASRRCATPRSSPPVSTRRSGTRGTRSSRRRPRAPGRSNAPSSATTIRSPPSRARSFRRTTSSTTTRRSTSTSTARELVIPADLKPGVLEDVQRLAVAAFADAQVRRDGAGGLLPARGGRAVAERAQHDPGIHVDLDVPEALGGIGRCPTRELVERLLDLAVERHEAERKSTGVRALGG